jgi:hypothetical protein
MPVSAERQPSRLSSRGTASALFANRCHPIPIAAELVRELADQVEEPAASTLRAGLDAGGRTTLALTIEEREQILRGLEDCPDGRAELRGVLVREHEWRVREGLA